MAVNAPGGEKSVDWPKLAKQLFGGLTLLSFLAGLSAAINVPYLHSEGAEGWPIPFPSTKSVCSSVEFLFLSALAGLLGRFIFGTLESLRRNTIRRFLLVATSAAAVLLGWLRLTHLHVESARLYSFSCWILLCMVFSIALPYVLRLLKEYRSGGTQDATPLVATGLAIVAMSLVVLLSYSDSVFIWLPDGWGGHELRSVHFRWSDKVPLQRSLAGLTESVWILFEDKDSYWVKHLNESRDDYVVDPFPKSDLGTPLSTSSTPAAAYSRHKRWDMRFPG